MSRIIKPSLPRLRRGHPLTNGLVGAWLFSEGAGNKAHDISGKENRGTLTSMDPSTDWVGGPNGYVLDLDGVNDHVNVGNKIVPTTGLTIIVKAFPRSFSSHRAFVGDRSASSSTSAFLFFQLSGSNLTFDTFSGGSQNRFSSGYNTPTGQWSHLAATFNGAEKNIYADGEALAAPNTDHVGTLNVSSVDMLIGRDSRADQYQFDGLFDHVYIFNRGLSAVEIKALYRDPFSILEPSRKIWLLNASVAPSGAVSGATTLSTTASGTLVGTASLSATAQAAFSPSATLIAKGSLSGSSSVAFTPSATANAEVDSLSGTAALTVALAGTLSAKGSLSGTLPLAFSPSATGTLTANISGASTITFAGSAGAQITAQVSGSSTLSFTPSATPANDFDDTSYRVIPVTSPSDLITPHSSPGSDRVFSTDESGNKGWKRQADIVQNVAPKEKSFPLASDTWYWVHNLGFRPTVEVYNTTREKLLSYVRHDSVNQLSVHHTYNATGYIVIR